MNRSTYLTGILLLIGGSPLAAAEIRGRPEAQAHYARAQVYLQQGAHNEALELLRNADRADKTNPEYRFAVADA